MVERAFLSSSRRGCTRWNEAVIRRFEGSTYAQEAAGLPLDASFVEQKRILQRCDGTFYSCRDGAEARRFNRLLIDAGLIKGL